MNTVRYHQIPYIELSVFTSIIAITLAYFFFQARLGLVNAMAGDVLKTLGISLLLLNLPLAISLRFKTQDTQLPWYQSQAFITCLTLVIIVFAGFIIEDHNYYLDYGLSMAGYLCFLFSAYKFVSLSIFSGSIFKKAIYLCLFFAFSLWATGIFWNTGFFSKGPSYRYVFFSPFFVESLYLGGAHSDTLLFSSLSQMIQTYGIPSTGLDGLPYIPYHFGSYWIFAQLSKLIQINPIYFYQLCYPVVFLPLYFYSFLLFMVETRDVYAPTRNSAQSLFNIFTFIIFAAAFISFLPHKYSNYIGFMRLNFLVSPSYLLSFIFTFLSFCLVVSFWVKFNVAKLFGRRDMVFLTVIIPALLICIGLTKISSIFIIFSLATYLFLRMALFKRYQFIVSYSISVCIVLVVLYYTFPVSQAGFSIKQFPIFIAYIDHQLKPFFLMFNYLWSFLFIYFSIKSHNISNMQLLKQAFSNRLTLSIESVIVVSVVGFLPGALMAGLGGDAYYFADFQKWIALPLLLALFDYRAIKLKPATIALILFLMPLLYVVYKNGTEKFLAYRSQMNQMREVVMNTPAKQQEIVNILLKLYKLPLSQKRNTALFIPQNNHAYWGLADKIGCPTVPFIAPALSGIAMVDGLPPADCGGRENIMLSNNGYECYQLRTAEQTAIDRANATVCMKALEKGFESIIRIDETEKGLQQTAIQCEDAADKGGL